MFSIFKTILKKSIFIYIKKSTKKKELKKNALLISYTNFINI